MPRLSFFDYNILVATGPLWFTKYQGRTSFRTFHLFVIGFPSGSRLSLVSLPSAMVQQSDFIKYLLCQLMFSLLHKKQFSFCSTDEDIHPTYGLGPFTLCLSLICGHSENEILLLKMQFCSYHCTAGAVKAAKLLKEAVTSATKQSTNAEGNYF